MQKNFKKCIMRPVNGFRNYYSMFEGKCQTKKRTVFRDNSIPEGEDVFA